MKTKTDVLRANQLAAIRQRLGAKSDIDTSRDDYINKTSPRDLARKFAGWHLGDESWADYIIDVYENAKKAGTK